MKIASWNVNGIRASIEKGFWEWFNSHLFDVVAIQENKAHFSDLKVNVNHPLYDLAWAQAEKKGYSGVSSWFKKGFTLYQVGTGVQEFDIEGRTIILECDRFFLINCYFPNGREDHSRVQYKLDFSYKILEISERLRNDFKKGVIICGDVNTAHHSVDLANPSQNVNTTGFLEIERKYLDDLVSKGYKDAFRLINPDVTDVYSWWSYRTRSKERNIGWRIDYFIVSEEIVPFVKDCFYMKQQNQSDHCPAVLELDFNIK